MIKFGKWIAKHRIIILVVAVLLLVPSIFGMISTRVNYDILYYLPGDIDTMKGQDILTDEFGTGAFAMYMVEGMNDKDVSALEQKIKDVDNVKSVIWYDDIADLSVPKEILPDKFYNAFNKGDTTLMAIFFKDTSSADSTLQAVDDIRAVSNEQCFLSGMSAAVKDTKDLAEREEPIYVLIAVICATIVMALFLDSYIMPVFFLLSIGMAILYNMGTNIFLGEISYITKALSAVLQLGVTMDYSIFLWHSYQEQVQRFPGDKQRAMAHAIKATITSVVGSSITTIAGFLALCFMSFTLGGDLGVVLAKGVGFGVLSCVTILPAMILTFDKGIEKTMHRSLMPKFGKLCDFITKHYKAVLCVFIILLIPMVYGYCNTEVYYKMDDSLPRDLDSIVANDKLQQDFDMSSTHMVLLDADVSAHDKYAMIEEMKQVDGVKDVLGLETVLGPSVPSAALPEAATDILQSGQHELMLVNSRYAIASDEVNTQIDALSQVIKKYDSGGMLIGEAPCTKDLITITDHDFQMVSMVSIFAIFVIILLVLQSISLPVILVAVIESAIFINLGIPYYTGTILPFIASIVIGTIQLGATVDYAILMTTRYKRERSNGMGKKESITIALKNSIQSIIVSALGFFAATFGVGLYSDIDIISSLCMLMARGALISMAVVIFILPAMFMIFDKAICKTSRGFLPKLQ
ncbi:MAG: MMPL family transporter [Christensenella sp.]|nr:MMPL family transporter [Christensenella sp.]